MTGYFWQYINHFDAVLIDSEKKLVQRNKEIIESLYRRYIVRLQWIQVFRFIKNPNIWRLGQLYRVWASAIHTVHTLKKKQTAKCTRYLLIIYLYICSQTLSYTFLSNTTAFFKEDHTEDFSIHIEFSANNPSNNAGITISVTFTVGL